MVESHALARRLAAMEVELVAHTRVCGERQGQIIARLNRVEAIMLTIAGTAILGLLSFVLKVHL